MNIPKASSTLQEVIDFYSKSAVFGRLAGTTQKDYEHNLLRYARLWLRVRLLGIIAIRISRYVTSLRRMRSGYPSGVRTANYRKSVLSICLETCNET